MPEIFLHASAAVVWLEQSTTSDQYSSLHRPLQNIDASSVHACRGVDLWSHIDYADLLNKPIGSVHRSFRNFYSRRTFSLVAMMTYAHKKSFKRPFPSPISQAPSPKPWSRQS